MPGSRRKRVEPPPRMLHKLLQDLTSAEAYPHPVEDIRVAQTHISCVFLTGQYAYKIKKAVRFAFLDYSTIQKRLEMSRREIELNRRLCPSVYVDVVPVIKEEGHYKIREGGKAVEWAVKMKQLRESDMLSQRLKQRRINFEDIANIARKIAEFHRNAVRSATIDEFGTPEKISRNAEENFQETESRSDQILPAGHLKTIESYTRDFLRHQKDLLLSRIKNGWIRDGHGDLRIQNICLQDDLETGVQVFDCIEFNDRLRFLDVASDIAYLAMDFDLTGRSDLRRHLLQNYRRTVGDETTQQLFRFYCCYRAYVRGKIALFASEEEEVPEKERSHHGEIAHAAFDLARSYTRQRQRPILIMMVGFSGSGKSALAEELARRLPAVLLATDVVRKQMASVEFNVRLGPEWYTPEKIQYAYWQMRESARDWLAKGENVVLDATFLSREERQKAAHLASDCEAALRIIECDCPDDLIRKRLQTRPQGFSDADIAVYESQKKMFEPVDDDPRRIKVVTDRPANILARELLID